MLYVWCCKITKNTLISCTFYEKSCIFAPKTLQPRVMSAVGDNMTIYRRDLRERILHKAMELFCRDGIRAVRMDDIASALQISKRTLYELYADKETLLHEGVRLFHELRRSEMHTFAESGKNVIEIIIFAYKKQVELFREVNPQFFADIEKYPKIREYFDSQDDINHEQFIAFLQRGIEEGFFRADLNLDIVIALFASIEQYLSRERLYERYPIEDIFSNIVLITIRGMCTPEGIHLIDKSI